MRQDLRGANIWGSFWKKIKKRKKMFPKKTYIVLLYDEKIFFFENKR